MESSRPSGLGIASGKATWQGRVGGHGGLAHDTNLEIAQIVSTDDPNGAFRLQVIIPALSGDTPVWASVCRPFAPGDSAFAMPDVGDEVLVGFVGGDPEMPIVLGSLSSRP